MADAKTYRLKANVAGKYRRGGQNLSDGRVYEGPLTEDQFNACDADPNVTVEEIEAEAPPKKKTGAKKATTKPKTGDADEKPSDTEDQPAADKGGAAAPT